MKLNEYRNWLTKNLFLIEGMFESMIFPFPRSDMLVSWRVYAVIYREIYYTQFYSDYFISHDVLRMPEPEIK